jgi:predicted secreted protein
MSVDSAGKSPKGLAAILTTLLSALLGGAYYTYLVMVPFPPDLVRIVPLVWLAAAFVGLMLGIEAIRTGSRKYLGVASVALNIPNVLLAAIFAMAALTGG